MNIKIFYLFLTTIHLSFSLTNDKLNDKLLRECGKHFENFNIVFPNWVGTLIHPQWCVGVAHAQPVPGTIVKINNQRFYEEFYVEKVITHPYYHTILKVQSDLCLVKLNKPVYHHPIVERQRDNTYGSSRHWIVSTKNGIHLAGLIKLCNVDKDVYAKSASRGTYRLIMQKNFSKTFYNTIENLKKGNYVCSRKADGNMSDQTHKEMNDNRNRNIQLSGLIPEIEESDLAVWIEHGDSGSPVFSYPANYYGTNLPPLEALKLIGIVVGATFPPDNLTGKGHMGSILRLSQGGLNEFIDDIIDKDSKGININAYLNMLTLKHALEYTSSVLVHTVKIVNEP